MQNTMTLADIEIAVNGKLAEQDEVIRCIQNLALTPAGTVPLDREFGVDISFLGMPIKTAKNILAIELINKIDKYEPRASVKEVDMTGTVDGQIKIRMVIESAR